ncbi:ABC transporter [Rhodothalassium salexigens]|uniref:ABC transporter ATP-binding protein n=1 Tax=Rhodothalassium salexigens TaxID=1086 RepID=UPI001914CC71|nr:ABC transporter ATP-binding protein [Rhodothalassium salexigens]MBK5911746.1 ABC transporter [Rhodothalassium salexigens]MBK5920466.1 ABC transporter [Rhodothalassium salexigens]
MSLVLDLDRIAHGYGRGAARVDVLQGVSLHLGAGEIAALIGQSGAGKSTLLHVAGLLERPETGRVAIAGQDAGALSERRRADLRGHAIGFVYQFHHLLPEFSALENVVLPQRIAGTPRGQAEARARHLLGQLGLDHRLDHRPGKLSGGEQQRVAIARALANRPALLLADEPTGNLDEDTAAVVMDELLSLVRTEGLAALIATHNRGLAERMDRTVTLKRGRLA